MDGRCFYCRQPIGAAHKHDCVLIQKRVKVRMIIEYEVDVPSTWDGDMVEFHRNESSWCAGNAIAELEDRFGGDGQSCGCGAIEFDYVEDTSGPFVAEGGDCD